MSAPQPSQPAEPGLPSGDGLLCKLARHVPGFVYSYRLYPDGRACFPFASAGVQDVYGVTPDQILETAQPVFDVLHPDDLQRIVEGIQRSAAELAPWHEEYRVIHPRKGIIWVHGTSSPERLDDGSIIWYGNLREITDERLAGERQRLQAELAAFSGDERALTTIAISEIERLTESQVGFLHFVNNYQQTIELVSWSERTRAQCHVAHATHYPIREAGVWADAFRRREPDIVDDYRGPLTSKTLPPGHVELQRFMSVPVFDGNDVAVLLGVGNKPVPYTEQDIETARIIGDYVWRSVRRRRAEAELFRMAHEDPLTGLPNRALLRLRLGELIDLAHRRQGQLAVLFLDLDRFKTINDTLGHSVGDALLNEVTRALKATLGEGRLLARIGGDELVVVIEDLPDRATAASQAQGLLDALAQPFTVRGRELHVGATIGVAIYPRDGSDIEGLLASADVAMYRGKTEGRNCWRFFAPEMSVGAAEALQLENALRVALERDELGLIYQPQVRLADGSMHGIEVLLRWQHPELGQVSPARFIPLAEEIGLIDRIGAWVLEQACRQLAAWDQAGLLVPRIAVNLSMQQIERVDLLEEVTDILKRTGVAADRLELEITESMLMRRADQVIENLHALHALDITLAIDDFGAGFSSVRYLKLLPIDRLKIDKGFIDNLTRSASDDAIARAVIAMGNSLGLAVLAEGVETLAQAAFLRREGCLDAQGWLYAKAMTPIELAEWLMARQ